MRQQIISRLSAMNSLEERQILKDVLADVFLNLHEHSNRMYHELEERVFSEMDGERSRYDIYASLVSRAAIDPLHPFLRLMREEDQQEPVYNFAELADLTATENGPALMQVFFDCEYGRLKELCASRRVFQGRIRTTCGEITAGFVLREQTEYRRQVAALYETFIDNGIAWQTVNHPFLYRFFNVFLEQCQRDLQDNEEIIEIEVDFDELSNAVHYDKVPLWNVEQLALSSSGFPLPCEDRINYEHCISLTDLGLQHGYLAINGDHDVRYVRRSRDAIIMVSSCAQREQWPVLRVIQPVNEALAVVEYPIVSNAKRRSFSDLQAAQSSRAIRSEAEIRRLVHSFAAAEALEFSHLEILPVRLAAELEADSYEMNEFILDEVRRSDYQNRLRLYFRKTTTDFLQCDRISFVLAELQLHYPEYKCEGVLL